MIQTGNHFVHRMMTCAAVLLVAACGGEATADKADPNDGDAVVEATKTTRAVDCASVSESKEADGMLGIAVGMPPAQASRILSCRGFSQSFPGDESKRIQDQEEKRGVFRRDFYHSEKREYVRLFFEGPANAQQIFAFGRGVLFDQNPPTMEAVARQYVDAYHPVNGFYRTHLGNIEASRAVYDVGDSGEPPEAVGRHCVDLAGLHRPDDRYSETMNRAPYPDARCGPSASLEVIQNGLNENLAYVARYRFANPQLGYRLREQRMTGEQSAAQAKIDRETQQANESGELPGF